MVPPPKTLGLFSVQGRLSRISNGPKPLLIAAAWNRTSDSENLVPFRSAKTGPMELRHPQWELVNLPALLLPRSTCALYALW